VLTSFLRVAASRTVRFPSQLETYPVLTIHISVTRSPERLRLWAKLKTTARSRGETTTKLVVRALARELTRCEAEMDSWPVSRRIEAQDRAVIEALKLLTDEERKKYGL